MPIAHQRISRRRRMWADHVERILELLPVPPEDAYGLQVGCHAFTGRLLEHGVRMSEVSADRCKECPFLAVNSHIACARLLDVDPRAHLARSRREYDLISIVGWGGATARHYRLVRDACRRLKPGGLLYTGLNRVGRNGDVRAAVSRLVDALVFSAARFTADERIGEHSGAELDLGDLTRILTDLDMELIFVDYRSSSRSDAGAALDKRLAALSEMASLWRRRPLRRD